LNACLIAGAPDGFVVALDLAVSDRQVLIIDDNPDAINLLRRFLSEQNYVCLEAHTAESGIQLARTLHPWLVILDVMMPDTDGWEVLQNLKHHPDTRTIPVLICSVLDIPEVALSLGADGYLKKPPHLADLISLLAQWEK
jgi:CheY-like chemotaxis protein